MNFKVRDASYRDAQYIIEKLGLYPTAAFVAVVVVDKAGTIVGSIGADHFTFNSCQLFIAVDRPACLQTLLRAGFDLAFNRAGMEIGYGIVNSDNLKSLRLTSRVGFKLKTKLENGWRKGVHLMVFEIEKQDCLWLRPRGEVRKYLTQLRRRRAA